MKKIGKHNYIKQFVRSEVTRSWALLLLTGTLAWFTYKLFEQTARSVDITEQSISFAKKADSIANESLKLAKRNADASDVATKKSLTFIENSNIINEKSLELARKRFVIENRPYIGIETITMLPIVEGKDITIRIVFQNYGKTPANQVNFQSWFDPERDSSYIDYRFDIPVTKNSYGTMPPTGKSETLVKSNGLNKNFFIGLQQKKQFIFVYGRVIYSDMFSSKDTTKFYYRYEVDSDYFRDVSIYNEIK